MTALAELQRQFAAALLDPDERAILRSIRPDGLAPAQRLQIYSNTAMLLLAEALKANFPATCRMVDERFFAYAAGEFLRRHPPRQPRLAEYGAEFADFLSDFEPAACLPWLPDLARLERLLLECQEAPEVTPLDPAEIAALPPARMPRLRLAWRPSAGLLASRWPVDALRDYALSTSGAPTPPIEGVPVQLLLRRIGEAMSLRRLGEDEHAVLERLRAGTSLAEALDGLASDPTRTLARALEEGVFAGPLAKA